MIKYKILLSRLIVFNVINATVALIVFLLLLPSGSISLFEIAWSMALFYGGFAILTVLHYNHFSKRIDKGRMKESDFMIWWERIKQNKELSQEEHSEDSDMPES